MRPYLVLLHRWLFLLNSQRQRSKGFTLLELLISLAIASVVVGGLLFGVVQLTTMDKREGNLDQVQRDMNRAMKYITDDLQEAVYVYTDPQDITTQLASDPAFPDGTGEVPILAFWRIDPIETGLPACVSTMSVDTLRDCQSLRIRQAAYTLVVYVQKTNDGNRNWPGQSRIIRYELSKYSGNIATLTVRAGYRDPTNPTDADARFEQWKIATGSVPNGFSAVLVDYVQNPAFSSPVTLNRAPLNDTDGACRGYGLDSNGNQLYEVVPSTATVSRSNTFFACVRNPTIGGGAANRGNQDVYVFLRGNVQGVSGGVRGYSDETSLPILETQVLVKGVVNKGFSQ